MDYGLAARRKQHSLETQLQDCHRALRWLHSGLRGKLVALHPALRAAAAAPLVETVGGESAGGHLSLTLALPALPATQAPREFSQVGTLRTTGHCAVARRTSSRGGSA